MISAKNILTTLAYYHVLGMPLTAFEIWRYLIVDQRERGSEETPPVTSWTFHQILVALDSLVAQGVIAEQRGFYCLFKKTPSVSSGDELTTNNKPRQWRGEARYYGHKPVEWLHFLEDAEDLPTQRIRHTKIAEEKWKKMRRAVWVFQVAPFVRGVFASGSLALGNSDVKSDLDVLIVTAPCRIFTARFFVSVLLWISGRYRHGRFISDRVCPNHYIAEDSLEVPFRSLYNAQTYRHLVPMVLRDGELVEKFYAANPWIGENAQFQSSRLRSPKATFGGQAKFKVQNQRLLQQNTLLRTIAMVFEVLFAGKSGDTVESFLRRIQLARIRKNPLTENPGAGHIIVNDAMLAFHPHSPESGILAQFAEVTKKLGIG